MRNSSWWVTVMLGLLACGGRTNGRDDATGEVNCSADGGEEWAIGGRTANGASSGGASMTITSPGGFPNGGTYSGGGIGSGGVHSGGVAGHVGLFGGTTATGATGNGGLTSGGNVSAGGASPRGGAPADGGTPGIGGAGLGGNATGGIDVGGRIGFGGATTTGGHVGFGGAFTSGGTFASGGALTSGGATTTGGHVGFGGAFTSGGTFASGGALTSGGATTTGGHVGFGGAFASGGAFTSGGAVSAGSSSTFGGATGGNSSPSGGVVTNGGTTTQGGGVPIGATSGVGGSGTGSSPATGGFVGQGGSTSAGGTESAGGSAGGSSGGAGPWVGCQCGDVNCGTCPVTPMVARRGYRIDAFETTNAEYAAFLATGPLIEAQPAVCSWNWTYIPAGDWPATGRPNQPVSWVDWCDAFAYCAWAGKRLCGARSGGSAPFTSNDDIAQNEWFAACTDEGAHAYPYGNIFVPSACNGAEYGTGIWVDVGSLSGCQVTGQGIYDMSGNVYEWENSCSTWDGGQDVCRARGGSFYSEDPAILRCRSASTIYTRSATRKSIGVRCCDDP